MINPRRAKSETLTILDKEKTQKNRHKTHYLLDKYSLLARD